MRSFTIITVLLAAASSSVYAQDQSIIEGIRLAKKGIAWVDLPYGIDYKDGIRLVGYSGWITLPSNGGPPCPAANEDDVNAKCN
ncbi:hypothetical protein EX30DRAFT_368886 [Ascodesmis nigricans]|uniref:Uncharacterized protein n=1 Tax=Ascodesmis nigricans TaxID=341454 RepID=A0A4S2N341_9PEZI|nr:hypothetical protein EX30DRAFT_368886 [Ascodesmis nigricans]